jgi:hypothetical protein
MESSRFRTCDYPVLCERGAAFCYAQQQLWKQQLCHAVCLFQMRVSGQDECLDSELVIFSDLVGDIYRIANQRGTGASANQSDARPQQFGCS